MACLYSWISVFTYIQLTMLAGNFKISLWVTCIRQETKKLTDQVFKEKVTLVGTISRSARMAKSVKRSLYILIKIVQFIINELLDKFFFCYLYSNFSSTFMQQNHIIIQPDTQVCSHQTKKVCGLTTHSAIQYDKS